MLVPAHRLFFALQPPRREAAAIGRMGERLRDIRARVADERLHATLAVTDDFADFPEALARRMVEIGDMVSATPLAVALDRLSASTRSVALRPGRVLPGLRELADQLQLPMERARMRRTGWTFSPHVTLGYRDGQPFSERVETIGWQCDEFVLIHSVVGRTQHHLLRRWPLVPRQYDLPLH